MEHYGKSRMTVGSLLRWKESRYCVVAIERMEDVSSLVYIHKDQMYGPTYTRVTDEVSVYTLRGSHGTIYTVQHTGGYMHSFRRMRNQVIGG